MKTLFAALLVFQAVLLADVNVWHRNTIPSNDSLFRLGGGMVYLPDSDRFLLSMGFLSRTFYDQPSPYSEQVMSLKDTLWKSLLPPGKLGLWGDTVGYCDSVAYNLYFRIETH